MCGNTHIGMCGCHLKPELWHPLEEGGIQVVVSRLKSNLGVLLSSTEPLAPTLYMLVTNVVHLKG